MFGKIKNDFKEGINRFVWDAKDKNGNRLSSGIYFVKLSVENRNLYRKVVLLR